MSKTLKTPPGPVSRFPLAHLFSLRRDLIGFFSKICRQYGDLVRVRVGPREVYFVNHPDLIREVLIGNQHNFIKSRGLQMSKKMLGEGLLTSEGDFHGRQRRLAQPAFHRQRLAGYADTMVRCAEAARESWRDGQTLDAAQEMMRLTLVIVGKTLFGSEVKEKEADDVGRALTEAMQLFNRVTNPFGEWLDLLPLPSNRRLKQAIETLDRIVYRMIREHREDARDRGDLLSMLLLAQDEEGDGGGMTDQQVRDEVMTIFLAGHETTATALAWTWHLLSRNPEAEARFHEEVDRILGDRRAGFEDAQKLAYTRMVFAESMRLYPPAYVIGRQSIDRCTLGGCDIPAGATLLMSQFVMHRDPRYFADPDRFDPERWTPEKQASRPRFSYFPFGGGARLCIGESFAWMEGVLVLATLAQRWKLTTAPGHPVQWRQSITLRLKHGLRVSVRRRRRLEPDSGPNHGCAILVKE